MKRNVDLKKIFDNPTKLHINEKISDSNPYKQVYLDFISNNLLTSTELKKEREVFNAFDVLYAGQITESELAKGMAKMTA